MKGRLQGERNMRKQQYSKPVHEGDYVAKVELDLI
jgi:hypothetical protein